jgi:hypothetical protein
MPQEAVFPSKTDPSKTQLREINLRSFAIGELSDWPKRAGPTGRDPDENGFFALSFGMCLDPKTGNIPCAPISSIRAFLAK